MVMIIPPQSITAEILDNILEEFITREGTDYGHEELGLEQKMNILRPQVLAGKVLIVFDDVLQSVDLRDVESMSQDTEGP
ncbi:MAG: hypothetical protein ACI93R_000604 [Flavobacteriales bacterium]|jgi:uncharacterized protein YheU (UPF0270 family)